MGAQLGSGSGPMADMNVTPLIDVVLVLLVVFMVITPMLQSGLPVDLPEATQTTTVNDVGQHIVVSIHPELGWAVEQESAKKESQVEKKEEFVIKHDVSIPLENMSNFINKTDAILKKKFSAQIDKTFDMDNSCSKLEQSSLEDYKIIFRVDKIAFEDNSILNFK